ncbi:hypothetical protein Syun_010857 [Stephania yunnanensis]|uniref:Uncharacterized protein n=1 Tax=Stephania yunnanensis TaxID=152371 RepID=A0AAP0PEW3_9MAGN
MESGLLNTDWEDVTCPICLDFPHNAVLLQCSSYDQGCRPFMCDTDYTHSNCLDRFRKAHGMSDTEKEPTTSHVPSIESTQPTAVDQNERPTCPLCRGEVTGWVVIEEARMRLNKKKRCCEEERCQFVGNYVELHDHAKVKHPYACPSKIDPARQLDWENFQQSSEIIDVLSTIHSEVPHGVVLGDYVIEYGGDDDVPDEFEDFPGDDGNWWTSCILYQVFDNFRTSRNRRRSRASESRQGSRLSNYDASNSDDSLTSVETGSYGVYDIDDEFYSTRNSSRRSSRHHRK